MEFAKKPQARHPQGRRAPTSPTTAAQVGDVRHQRHPPQPRPHRPPFLLVDGSSTVTETSVAGIKNVTMNEPLLVHFPEEPVCRAC